TYLYFFFSSRRRHTRSDRDWSSDVCSSDLAAAGLEVLVEDVGRVGEQVRPHVLDDLGPGQLGEVLGQRRLGVPPGEVAVRLRVEIGRASCRERENMWVDWRAEAQKLWCKGE